LHQREKPVPLRDIAQRQGISKKYLEQIIFGLEKSGMVRSVRGTHGGYLLNKQPAQISVLDIAEAIEGEITIRKCVEDPTDCLRSEICSARLVWCNLTEAIRNALASYSLADLVREQHKMEKSGYSSMYHI
jgi:Rrf2 family cysteine metabolism transcriptional repressor